jgi:predicted RNase H-like HicB family nuclease
MTVDILVKPVDNGFQATVIGLPDCTAEAPTRDEAIEQARQEARELIAEGEVVRVELEGPKKYTKPGIGMWADDELFDEFVAEMKRYREQVDADPNQP